MADAMDMQEQEAYRKATGSSIGGADKGELGKAWNQTFKPQVHEVNPAAAKAYQERMKAEDAARRAAPSVNPYQQGKRGVYGNM